MEKICGKCKESMDVTHFYNRSRGGYSSYCKTCSNKSTSEYYFNNKVESLVKLLNRSGVYKCSKCSIFKTSRFFSKDASKHNKISNTCKPCFKIYSKKYRLTNKPKIAEYYKNKYNTDLIFKVRMNLKNSLNNSLKSPKSATTEKIVGCDFNKLILHLNNNEYGFIYGNKGLDIDHIIPVSKADSEYEVLELFNYKNLQLLPSEYNRCVKRDNEFNKKHFEEWLKNN